MLILKVCKIAVYERSHAAIDLKIRENEYKYCSRAMTDIQDSLQAEKYKY